jgi:hypothetical protein
MLKYLIYWIFTSLAMTKRTIKLLITRFWSSSLIGEPHLNRDQTENLFKKDGFQQAHITRSLIEHAN